MEKYFTIGEAAKEAHATAETLRHYDRIGLVHPSKRERETGYRYYTQDDIVRLHTVRALQQMDLPLKKIQEILREDDLNAVVAFLEEAERKAEEKIAALQRAKEKIRLAKADYEEKLRGQESAGQLTVRTIPERAILLSDSLESPALDNLWGYLRHFYAMLEAPLREQFQLEDAAGILFKRGVARMFALCKRYVPVDAIEILPAGKYLCGARSGRHNGTPFAHGKDAVGRAAGILRGDGARFRRAAVEIPGASLYRAIAFSLGA